jgi:hypothetical protein
MIALKVHLAQAATEIATATTAAGVDEVRTLFTGILLASALATVAAIVAKLERTAKLIAALLADLLKTLLLALLAGLVVVAVLLLAVADLLSG